MRARHILRSGLALGAAALFGAFAPAAGNASGGAVERLLELDPLRVSASDVLAQAPAPRIILIQGSLPLVTMEPFAEFLIAMGYPRERLRNPSDGSYSSSSFGSSAELAGTLAWYYEREGMMPMLIGHSQGGMLVIRTLHELAGRFASEIPVWDPVAGAALPRTTIVDPATGTAQVRNVTLPAS